MNASGPGKPSDMSEPVLVEARPGELCPLPSGGKDCGKLGLRCARCTEAVPHVWGVCVRALCGEVHGLLGLCRLGADQAQLRGPELQARTHSCLVLVGWAGLVLQEGGNSYFC